LILLKFERKYLLILLITTCHLDANGQFNTIRQLMKPVLKPLDSGQEMQNDSVSVNQKLDSISWRFVMEEFQKDTDKGDSAQTPLRLYLPLRSIQITSPFGNRFHPIEKVWKMHNGVDLKAYYEPVFAMADGVVKIAGFKEREGNYIVITHGDIESIYCHLSILLSKQGQL
jgi:murein DD-endopeptidase MepM/ murein hydrolase activator NlpD